MQKYFNFFRPIAHRESAFPNEDQLTIKVNTIVTKLLTCEFTKLDFITDVIHCYQFVIDKAIGQFMVIDKLSIRMLSQYNSHGCYR